MALVESHGKPTHLQNIVAIRLRGTGTAATATAPPLASIRTRTTAQHPAVTGSGRAIW